MKVFAILAICLLSANVFAVEKTCYGAKNDDQVHGTKFTANIEKSKITITGSEWAGTYPVSKGANVEGKDGITYLNYDVNGSDGCDTLLVAKQLTSSDGQGWVKFRCRGEGFSDSKFFCHD